MPNCAQKIVPEKSQRGVALLFVVMLLFAMLAMAMLAVDGVRLYAARSEAQRAADAGALAGAKAFVDTGFTSGVISQDAVKTIATQRAQAVAALNSVASQAAAVQNADVTFDFSHAGDPLITVVVQRTAARSNAVPTFFARLWGFATANIKAQATAEAFNPSGTGVPVAASCAKPWVLPNCDDDPSHSTPGNPNCPGKGYFIDPTNGSIVHPGPYSAGGVIGQPVNLKPGDPKDAPVPSQYYPVIIPAGQSVTCPSCASSGGGGAALYKQNIECCSSTQLSCGSNGTVDLSLKPGNMQGPTYQGVSCLIHEGAQGSGQDILDLNALPLTFTGGTNNPNSALVGQSGLTSSDSVVTVPIYDGHQLCPGGSCNATVTVIGFVQFFIKNVAKQSGGTVNKGDVDAFVLNVAGCGTGGSGGGGPIVGGGISPIPIRLVHP